MDFLHLAHAKSSIQIPLHLLTEPQANPEHLILLTAHYYIYQGSHGHLWDKQPRDWLAGPGVLLRQVLQPLLCLCFGTWYSEAWRSDRSCYWRQDEKLEPLPHRNIQPPTNNNSAFRHEPVSLGQALPSLIGSVPGHYHSMTLVRGPDGPIAHVIPISTGSQSMRRVSFKAKDWPWRTLSQCVALQKTRGALRKYRYCHHKHSWQPRWLQATCLALGIASNKTLFLL